MTADSTVAEIKAAGGIALGVEVDVRDHEAVEAMVARVVETWGRVDVLVAKRGRRSRQTRRYQGQHTRSSALTTRDGNESFRDRLFVQRRRPGHEAAALREDHHDKLGGWVHTVRR